MKKLLTTAGVGLAFIGFDQLLKLWCSTHFQLLDQKSLLGQKWLILSYSLNRGIALDYFSWLTPYSLLFYTRYLPAVVLFFLLLGAALRFREGGTLERLSFSLLLAGGISNLWDHWHSIFVVDTIQVYIGNETYLPFNLADVGITLGAVLLTIVFIKEIFRSEPKGSRKNNFTFGHPISGDI